MSVPDFERGRVSVYFGEKSGKYPDGNQVVVRGRDAKAAFDTPLVARRLDAELEGVDLVILGHAHEDHLAGLGRLPHARVLAPEGDLAAVQSWDGLARHYGYAPQVLAQMKTKIEREFHYVPRPDAAGYRDGATWELGGARVRAFHMPGHTTGHTVLLVEPEGIAFIGDIDLSSFGPYYGDATSSLAAFRRTLRAVADIPASLWVTSHHKGVIAGRETFLALLAAYAGKLEAREQAVAAAVGHGVCTLDALVEHRFMYPCGYQDIYIDDAERRTILQHLDSLIERGQVAEDAGRYRLAR
jgi:glyoxylase-like metal-dependent hydrolase (beta-lactamase superfamily II)